MYLLCEKNIKMTKLIVIITFITMILACKSKNEEAVLTTFDNLTVQYPSTSEDNSVVDVYFGDTLADPYRWLEDDMSAETGEWVKAQNDVTYGYLDQIPFRKAIKDRYTELFNYEKYSAPFKEGEYTYYFKNSGLQNQSVLYREKEGDEAEVFLDPNTFSKDGTTSLAGISFSKDGSMLAYNISEGGSDWQKVIVMDAINKKSLQDTLDIKFSGASWLGNDGFYYATYAKAGGSVLSGLTDNHKIYYHKVGTPQTEDKMIYGSDTKPTRYMGAYVSENQKWLFISTANETYGGAVYAKDLTNPESKVIPIVDNMSNSHYVIDADDQYFYLVTDLDAPNNKVVRAPIANPGQASWEVIIPEKPEALNASTGGGYIFCSYLKDAITQVIQYDMSGKMVREIALPGPGSAYGFGGKKGDKDLYYTFTSYINPATIYNYDMKSGESKIFKESQVKFNPSEYESKQVFYTSKDGTKIPMIITHKKGLKLDKKNPCMLYGYGGFGVSLTPYFSTSNIILLENGGVYAVPNLRGGGEYGKKWHDQGILMKKQNVFDDFQAAADYLVDNGYTSRDLLAISGGSNGGLLVGACMTQDPTMCKVALPAVGVMDMLRYHKFTAGAGWAYDYGTSEQSKEMYDYLKGYSPLHNIKQVTYPATMITTADHDDRVVPAHSFKFAAEMQKNQQGDNPVLIRIETNAGHGAGKSTDQIINEQADVWSFMFYNIGLKPKYLVN
jgi:prolyl oligopeptidase